MDVIESGVAAVTGILGIGLIAASGRTNTKSKDHYVFGFRMCANAFLKTS